MLLHFPNFDGKNCRGKVCGGESIPKVEGQLTVAKEVEGATVVGCGAMLLDALAVLFGGIAGVVVPAVVRVLLVELLHVVVAISLGKDGGSSDGKILAIAFHDGGVGQGMTQLVTVAVFVISVESVAVDDEGFGAHGKGIDGSVHGCDAGTKDVHLVDFGCGHDAQCPGNGIALDFLAERIALVGGELLGVVQTWVLVVFGQDDGGCIDATCKTTSPCFVATCFDELFMIKR